MNIDLVSREEFRTLTLELEKLKDEIAKIKPVKTEKYIDTNQVCSFLGISKTTLAKHRKEGRMPFTKLGTRTFRYKRDDVEKLRK